MTDLHLIVDSLLPGDPDHSLPPASGTDFIRYLDRHSLQALAADFIEMLDKMCMDKFALAFDKMDPEQQLKAINACKVVNVRLFSGFVTHLLKAYYTCPIVLERIGAGSFPPFPQGNMMDHDDWTVLEPVYERGKCYRDV
jgi:hypothetical protein